MSRETLAEVIEQHRLVVVTGGTAAGSQWICECGAQQLNPGARDHARRMHAQHVAHHLADHVRAKQAEALREAAEAAARTMPAADEMASDEDIAHYDGIASVVRLLRDRADRIGGDQ